MDQMPDVQAYLEANPNVAAAITAFDGGIYHLPYVAEIDNYARVFAGRPALGDRAVGFRRGTGR